MNYIWYTIFGILLPFICTIIGASLIFCLKNNLNKKLSAIITGFSAGIMFAASIWSMIIPSFTYTQDLEKWNFIPVVIGTILGCLFVLLTDIIMNKSKKWPQKSSIFSNKNLSKFLIAFTVHNIPEGLAVGFAIGGAMTINSHSAFIGALGLAIGIAIQNLPEGTAVAMPIFNATNNKTKSFWGGVLSGAVEPVFALIGLLLATHIKFLMPWLLCFSAGCMIFVSIEDLIPDSKMENSHIGTWAFMIGFLIMMTLDIVLG